MHDAPERRSIPAGSPDDVRFEDVSFSYDGKRPAIADLTFHASPGEVIALVGPTGAGKTTALALLHRVFDPQSGRITIDGNDLRAMKLSALRRNIGVVFQEVLLFNRSIRGKPAGGQIRCDRSRDARSVAARAGDRFRRA